MNNRPFFITFMGDVLKLASNPRFIAPCVAGAFMLIVGTVLGVQYSFNMAAVLFALPVASYIMAVFSLRGIKIKRMRMASTTEGNDIEVSLSVDSSGISPRLRLKLLDTLPKTIESDVSQGIDLAICEPGSIRVRYHIRPRKRGIFDIGPVYLTTSDPLDIFQFRRDYDQRSQLIVYPRRQKIPLEKLWSGEGLQQDETASSGKKGQGMDLHGVREYAPGDPLRRIHWKTTARKGSLVVAEFEQTAVSEIVIAVECAKGTDYPVGDETSLDIAARVAAYIADFACSSGFPVRLLMSAGSGITNANAKYIEEREQILYALAKAQADSNMTLTEIVSSAGLTSDQTLILLTPVLDSELVREISGMTARGMKVGCVLLPGAGDKGLEMLDDLRSCGVGVITVEGGTGNA